MALYLGSGEKVKIKLSDGETFRLNIPTISTPIVSSIMLKSLDGYILMDSKGLYLTAKEDK